jgi:hypothetical protein
VVAASLTISDVVAALDEASSCGVAFVVVVSLVVGDAVATLENASACDAAYVAVSEEAASYSLTDFGSSLFEPNSACLLLALFAYKNQQWFVSPKSMDLCNFYPFRYCTPPCAA